VLLGSGLGLAGGRERERGEEIEKKEGKKRSSPRLTSGIRVFCEKEEKKLGFSFGGLGIVKR
jgi:hypothetical protein